MKTNLLLIFSLIAFAGCVTTKPPSQVTDSHLMTIIGGSLGPVWTPANLEPHLQEAVKRGLIREKFLEQVRSRKIQRGMTRNEVVASWGRPTRVNESTYSFGKRTQLVYENNYVYLDDGLVTSWSSHQR